MNRVQLADVIEVAQASRSTRRVYIAAICACLLLVLCVSALRSAGIATQHFMHAECDFDTFYLVGQMVWRGRIADAYEVAKLAVWQYRATGQPRVTAWTYPPQFDLLVALLALLPRGVAFGMFIAGTLAAYLAVLRRISGDVFVTVLILMMFPIATVIMSGQNGLLTGALIGLACLGFAGAGGMRAGLPLGLLVIKPHLAVAFALYTLVNRQWGAFAWAALTVAVTSLLATLVLGADVWPAVLLGFREAASNMHDGHYPFERMISVYAAMRSFGVGPALALALHCVAALLALGFVIAASRRMCQRQALGLTCMASLLVSPYAYDYDLPIVGIGLGLLLPDLMRRAGRGERSMLYALVLTSPVVGILQTISTPSGLVHSGVSPVSLAGPLLMVVLVLAWRLLVRQPLLQKPA